MEHLSLEVNILDPDLGRFHMLPNGLNCPLKELLDQLVSLRPKNLLVVLVELKVARPQVDLGGVVPDRLLEDLGSLLDCADEFSGLLGVLTWSALKCLLILHKKVGVACYITRVNRVTLTDLFQHIHILFIAGGTFSSLCNNNSFKVCICGLSFLPVPVGMLTARESK